ncbi:MULTISPECIES: hypothetical protein [unclassified Microbacterium]|uniref:hypothetical protein n=1 Tax=unclassified Microbacterium TaxID=2609290 RepID=UPI000DE45778|nr:MULTISPECIES: hypothetical protein [unclassified Microbacterium]NYF30062.1 hypothetical protein [Microbacterium sp. JAI119]RBO71025.1 hypothetical protein DSP71_18740 [Microbacterium sp. H6]
MPAAYGNKSRSVHTAVRDLVSLYLDARGIPSTSKRTPTSLSDSLGEDALDPDLALDGVDLKVTSRLRPFRISEDLEMAQRTAAIRGTMLGALIQWRSEQPIEQAYAIVSLDDFAKLVRGDHLPPP